MERLDPQTWSLISADLAREHRVLPLDRHEDRIRLIADRNLLDREREALERSLSFFLGSPVVVENIEVHPELELGGFNELMDRYYGLSLPTACARPVSTDFMTLLLVTADRSRSRDLECQMRACGVHVVHVTTMDEALAFAKERPRAFWKVLVASDIIAATNGAVETLSLAMQVEVEELDHVLAGPDPYGRLMTEMQVASACNGI